MKILIIEDDPAEAELAVEALSEVDSSILIVVIGDGLDALAFLRREAAYSEESTPDLVLLDLNLPGKDGRSVLQEIKGDPELCQLPVIVLSNSDAEEDIEHVYRHSGNCYVVKPQDMQGMYCFADALTKFWGERVQFSPGLA